MEYSKETTSRLLLGVTGSIATGKSTVARMLEKAGAPMIDFDLLARKVVEPGEDAWKDIVDFFGREVLTEEGMIDRKRLSDIVFRNPGKRKKLESLTHPRIQDEYYKALKAIFLDERFKIIQAVVPLLYEVKMQDLFDRILVVRADETVQIERLMKRDAITEDEARRILGSQMPISDKVELADFVIDNTASVAETQLQVNTLWEKLQKLQEEKT